jgi:hypothetical protein
MIVLLFVEYIILTVQYNWNVHNYFSFHIVISTPPISCCDHSGKDIEAFYLKPYLCQDTEHQEVKFPSTKLQLSYNELVWYFRDLTLSRSIDCGLMILILCINI